MLRYISLHAILCNYLGPDNFYLLTPCKQDNLLDPLGLTLYNLGEYMGIYWFFFIMKRDF